MGRKAENEVMQSAQLLHVIRKGSFDAVVEVRLQSVTALAILKFLGPSENAEFRDPINHETYRYSASTGSLYRAITLA
jgi:hypothetical protein